MVSIEEAQALVLQRITPLETETVPLLQGLHRVTSEEHVAPWDIPPADNSAMDGYAFAHASLESRNMLMVAGFLAAGQLHSAVVAPGPAVKIMTGAAIPAGCDTVVPIEEVVEEGDHIRLTQAIKPGAHVRKRGEDIQQGSVVIPAGSLLRPQEIGMLSAMGKTSVTLHRRARVAILATGDELLEPGSTPSPGKIINSNSHSLAAQVLDAGGEPIMLGIASDTLEESCERIRQGQGADLLVISGGVSVGDRDFVRMAIEAVGGELLFWKVNMKPGKPLAFALLQGKPVFALPGNPVAAMVSFELFVRPAILKAMGHGRIFRPTVKALLDGPAVNKGSRPHLVRGVLSRKSDHYQVSTTGNQSSGRLSSLTQGNCLLKLPPEASLNTGQEVEAILLDRTFEMTTPSA
ncbi:MAG TPA: gephyrin-like molybdotransferase Glp [Geobacterales bacterium]|nr:gephyrin-like molybdotransferase Glp [Geobacterales bacterium]